MYIANVNMKIAEFILCRKSVKTVLFWAVPAPANVTLSPSFKEGSSRNGKILKQHPNGGMIRRID